MADQQTEINRGQRAEQILNDELVVSFFADAERELWNAWKTSPLRDAEGREKLRLMQAWLNKFRETLETHVTTGRMASMALQEQQTVMQRMRSAVLPRSWMDADE